MELRQPSAANIHTTVLEVWQKGMKNIVETYDGIYGMIYVMTFAFVNYFPAEFLLRKPDMAMYPEIFMYITPVVGGCNVSAGVCVLEVQP